MAESEQSREMFPVRMFMIYVLFYAGQAMYNTFLNLFLYNHGMQMDQIGFLSSFSTLVLVLIQPLWGVLSDKSKSKNRIIAMLLIVSAIALLSFYAMQAALWLSFCVVLFNVFFNPAVTLQDNYTLELLEHSRWDFGQLRLGGTVGYAVCSLLVGFIIGTNYGQIFWMMALLFLSTAVLYFTSPNIAGHRQKHQKVKYSVILKNKMLVSMFLFNIVYYIGTAFYYQFYSIYFQEELGASSGMVGMLSMFSALAEIPFFWFAAKLQKRFGTRNLLLFAGIATAFRWFTLAFATAHWMVLAINMLNGCGFVGFSYSLIKFINDNVPKEMRATTQSLNGILGILFSRIIFTPIGGVLADRFGVQPVLIANGVLITLGVVLFAVSYARLQKQHESAEQKSMISA